MSNPNPKTPRIPESQIFDTQISNLHQIQFSSVNIMYLSLINKQQRHRHVSNLVHYHHTVHADYRSISRSLSQVEAVCTHPLHIFTAETIKI